MSKPCNMVTLLRLCYTFKLLSFFKVKCKPVEVPDPLSSPYLFFSTESFRASNTMSFAVIHIFVLI